MGKPGKYEYILGDSSYEVRRLAFQAGVWRDMTDGLFEHLKVGPGWRCVEVGAGTGTVSFPLAERVKGRGGQIDLVERSPRYADYLRRGIERRRLKHARVVEAEILNADLPRNRYDLVFARWVFLFLPKVEEHLRKMISWLKPGGMLAIEDYHRDSMAIYPRLSTWSDLVIADRAWFASQGGDLNIAGRLPGLYRKLGLKDIQVIPHMKVGFPGSDVWNWAEAYFIKYLGEMSRFKPFTPARARLFKKEWMSAKRNPSSLFISPAILDVIGRKSR